MWVQSAVKRAREQVHFDGSRWDSKRVNWSRRKRWEILFQTPLTQPITVLKASNPIKLNAPKQCVLSKMAGSHARAHALKLSIQYRGRERKIRKRPAHNPAAAIWQVSQMWLVQRRSQNQTRFIVKEKAPTLTKESPKDATSVQTSPAHRVQAEASCFKINQSHTLSISIKVKSQSSSQRCRDDDEKIREVGWQR